jgi:hypothetical protein
VPSLPQVLTGPKGKLTGARRIRVRRGRFSVKVTFAPSTPAGDAVLVVRAGSTRVGRARFPVRAGRTVTAKVRLTKAGQRRLARRGRLKVRLRLTVNGAVTRRALTLRGSAGSGRAPTA